MWIFARRAGTVTVAAMALLAFTSRRADGVINPVFQVPFGVSPYFRIRPGLTVSQAYYNIATLGQAYANVPPYALGYNPYVSTYAMPVAPMYGSPYAYPAIGSYAGYANPYMPMTPAYSGRPTANLYAPPASLSGESGLHKGFDRLGGLLKADGSLDWPLGLRVLPPAIETARLRKQIAAEVVAALDRAVRGKSDRASMQQVNHDIDRLEALLRERAMDVPLTDQAVADARRFLHNLKGRIMGLATASE